MKGKLWCRAIMAVIIGALLITPVFAANVEVSAQNLTVDGKTIDCEKYNTDGNNYFKLRDMAYLLNGTDKQFSVGWDSETSTVSITTGQAYTPDGSEMVMSGDKSSTAKVSAQTIKINGEIRDDLTVYNMGDNNYFRLRDLGTALDFFVDYNAETNTAIVQSKSATDNSPAFVEKEVEFLVKTTTKFIDINDGTDELIEIWEYDEYGNITREGNTASGYIVYTYDDRGNCLSETSEYSTIMYEYDSKDRCISEKETYNNGDTYTTTYEYDSKDRCISEKDFDMDGTIFRSITYSYDDENKTYSKIVGDGAGNVYTSEVNTYGADEWGETRTKVWTDFTHGGIATTIYDGKGNVVEYTSTSLSGELWATSKSTFTYNANGDVLEEVYRATSLYDDGTLVQGYEHTYTYDDANNLIRDVKIHHNDSGHEAGEPNTTTTTTYTYDEKGRITQEKTTVSFESSQFVDYIYYLTCEYEDYADGGYTIIKTDYDNQSSWLSDSTDGYYELTYSKETYDARGDLIMSESRNRYYGISGTSAYEYEYKTMTILVNPNKEK